MKHISEINHCIPNKRAYWCSKCKCHSQYTVNSSGNYKCLHCGFSQFRPQSVLPWMYGLLGFVLVTLVVAVLCGLHLLMSHPLPFYFLDEFIERGGLLCMLGFALFFGLLGMMMKHYLKQWKVWYAEQRWKSPSELEVEALQHQHQPVHSGSEYFDEWAEQFLSEDQVRELNVKYGSENLFGDDLFLPKQSG